MLATITAITINVDEEKYNNYVQHLVQFHNYSLADAQQEVRQEIRKQLRQRVKAADLPIDPNIVLTWNLV